MPQLMRKEHFKLMYEEIKHLYKDIRIRLVAEDITLFLITNPQIRNQSENDKVFNVAINIQIHRVMEASNSSYESSVDYVNFFLGFLEEAEGLLKKHLALFAVIGGNPGGSDVSENLLVNAVVAEIFH